MTNRALWLTCFLVALTLNSVRAQLYSVTDLGLGGGINSAHRLMDINASGQVAYDNFMGTLPGGTISAARAINDSGTLAGIADDSGFIYHAVTYSGGVLTDLGNLGSDATTYAINSSGAVVGSSWDVGWNTEHAFVYSGGTMTNLKTAWGATFESSANDINSSGVIIGNSDGVAGGGLYYSGGTVTPIGTLTGGTNSITIALNDNNDIVGTSDTGSGDVHGFLYSGGVMTDLGTALGQTIIPYDINNLGVIVGYANINNVSYGYGASSSAFIYSGGIMLDLNTMLDSSGAGWELDTAFAINDSGQIVGFGFFGGVVHAYLLTPVPEPSTWLSFATGISLLGTALCRSKKF